MIREGSEVCSFGGC